MVLPPGLHLGLRLKDRLKQGAKLEFCIRGRVKQPLAWHGVGAVHGSRDEIALLQKVLEVGCRTLGLPLMQLTEPAASDPELERRHQARQAKRVQAVVLREMAEAPNAPRWARRPKEPPTNRAAS